jgi:hypothetical protein
MTTKKKAIRRKDGITQSYHIGRSVPAREATATPQTAPPAPLAPARVDYASLVSSPGRPSDSRVEQDVWGNGWEYSYSLDLDRRTGKATWREVDSNHSGTTFDQHHGHIVGWGFSEPLAGVDKQKTFEAVREDLGRLVDGYYNEFNGQNLVARNADDGTDWDALNERIEAAFAEASSGEDWAQNRAIEEFEDTEERVTAAVEALALEGADTELAFAEDGGVYLTLTDRRTGEEVTETVDSTNDETVNRDLRLAVKSITETVERFDADEAWEDDDEE